MRRAATGAAFALLGASCAPGPLDENAGPARNDPAGAAAPARADALSRPAPEGLPLEMLHLAWGQIPSGPLSAASGAVAAKVINQTKATVTGELHVVTSGLDGKLVQSPLGPFSVAAGGTLEVAVPVSALSLQSEASSSFVALEAEIAGRDGAVLRPSTDPLYYHFEGGYQRALFYSSADLLAKHAGGAILPGASPGATGRLRAADGTWRDVALGGVSSPVGLAAPGARGAFTGVGPTVAALVPAEQMAAIADRAKTVPSAERTSAVQPTPGLTTVTAAVNFSVTVCSTWRVKYIDAGFGEDALATSQWQDAPARFAYSEIWQGSTNVWSGFLNSSGCVSTSVPSGSLQFRQFTTNTREWTGTNPNYINSFVASASGMVSSLMLSTNFNVSAASSFTFHPTTNVPAVQVAAVAAQILFANANTSRGLGLNGYSLNVRAPFGCGPAVDPPTDSCYDPGTDFTNIGTTVVGNTNAAHSSWKSIIAHEIGHHIQHRQWGTLPNDYFDNATSEPLCRCDHYTTAWSNQFHCMNSREFMGAAEVEAYAHASATRSFNNDDSGGNAKYVYYKPFLGFFDGSDPEVVLPPVTFTLSSSFRPRWLATQCPSGLNHEGGEYDWLTFYYAISVAAIANPTTFNDLANIYKRACTGGTGLCNGQDPSWSTLTSSALAYYGGSATNPKYVRFRDTGSSAAVNF